MISLLIFSALWPFSENQFTTTSSTYQPKSPRLQVIAPKSPFSAPKTQKNLFSYDLFWRGVSLQMQGFYQWLMPILFWRGRTFLPKGSLGQYKALFASRTSFLHNSCLSLSIFSAELFSDTRLFNHNSPLFLARSFASNARLLPRTTPQSYKKEATGIVLPKAGCTCPLFLKHRHSHLIFGAACLAIALATAEVSLQMQGF